MSDGHGAGANGERPDTASTGGHESQNGAGRSEKPAASPA